MYQGLTKDVSSEVGAPWRCGVLTTFGGIAGIGLSHLLGREHDSTPQSGVEAPRLLKRSLSRLYYCCFGPGHSTRCLCRQHRSINCAKEALDDQQLSAIEGSKKKKNGLTSAWTESEKCRVSRRNRSQRRSSHHHSKG